VRATRRTIEFVRGAFRLTLTSETVRNRGPELVLNGTWWAHEYRSALGVRYESIRPATRREMIEFAHRNVNPQTGAGVLRGQVGA
jgi:hypothetical protein